MDRRGIATLVLMALVVLAGCSYDTNVYLTPVVEEADPADDGSYELQVTADVDLEGTDGTFSSGRIDGYTLAGERACTARFGDLSEDETRTMVCDSFPSLVVSDTADRNETIPAEEGGAGPDAYDVQTIAKLYYGDDNGTHRFETFTWLPDRRGQFTYEAGHPRPTETTLQTMQCGQWRKQEAGADFSALDGARWLDWEQRPPNTSRTYEVRLKNYTHLQHLDRSDDVPLDQDEYVYSSEEAPPELGQFVRSATGTYGDQHGIDRTTFYAIVSGLADQRVNSTENLSGAMSRIRGTADSYDNTGIDCRTNPPQYEDGRGKGQNAKAFVSDGEDTWVVDVRTRETYSGPAFHNVTEP